MVLIVINGHYVDDIILLCFGCAGSTQFYFDNYVLFYILKALVLQDIIQSMPHDAHPMGVLVSAMSTLSIFHPDANPALRVRIFYPNSFLPFVSF